MSKGRKWSQQHHTSQQESLYEPDPIAREELIAVGSQKQWPKLRFPDKIPQVPHTKKMENIKRREDEFIALQKQTTAFYLY